MCIAILKKKGVSLPSNFNEQILSSAYANRDGLGLALWRNNDNKIHVKKGYIDNTEAFIKYVEELNVQKEDVLLVHARIGTSGNKNDLNCHPFVVSKVVEECTLTEGDVKKPVVIHNGVFHKYTDKASPYSDTFHFANSYLTGKNIQTVIRYYPEMIKGVNDIYIINDHKNRKFVKINNDFGGKVVVLFPNGYTYVYGEFIEDNEGMLYSNTGYKNRKLKNYGGRESTWDDEEDVYNQAINGYCNISHYKNNAALVKSLKLRNSTLFNKNFNDRESDEGANSFVANFLNYKDGYALITSNKTSKILHETFKYKTANITIDTQNVVFTLKEIQGNDYEFYINGNNKFGYTTTFQTIVDNLKAGLVKVHRINDENDIKIDNNIYIRQLYTDMLQNKNSNLVALDGKDLRLYTKAKLWELFKEFWNKEPKKISYYQGELNYTGDVPEKTTELLNFLGYKEMLKSLPASGTHGYIRHNIRNSIYDTFDFIDKNGKKTVIFVSPSDIKKIGELSLILGNDKKKEKQSVQLSLLEQEKAEEQALIDEIVGRTPVYN